MGETPWYKDPTNALVINHERGDFAATAMVYGAELTDLRAEVDNLRQQVDFLSDQNEDLVAQNRTVRKALGDHERDRALLEEIHRKVNLLLPFQNRDYA